MVEEQRGESSEGPMLGWDDGSGRAGHLQRLTPIALDRLATN